MLEEEDLITEEEPSKQLSAMWTFSPGDIGEEEEEIGWGGMQVVSSDHEDEEEAEEEVTPEQVTPEPREKQKVKAERTSSKVLTEENFSSTREVIVPEDQDGFGPIHSPTASDGLTPLERARLQLSKKSETASARSRQKASLKMSLKNLSFSGGTPLDLDT
jgi:hypothetical protein